MFLAPLLIGMGWSSPRQAAGLSAPSILANSLLGLVGVLLAGQYRLAPGTPLYAAAALGGAVVGTAVGLRRQVLAVLLAFAGARLLLR